MTSADPPPGPRSVHQPIRSRAGGIAVMVLAPVAAALLFLLLLVVGLSDRLLIIAAVLLGAGAWRLIEVGRRMTLSDGWDVMRRDARPPVIYLRPFQEDRRRTYDAPVGKRVGGSDVSAPGQKRATREPRLAPVLRRIGPFIAVGKPGDSLAPIGAARIYVSDDEWQSTVTALVKRAAAIVLQPEWSGGALWELELVAATADLRRVLILVPNPALRPLGYARVASLIAQALRVALPEIRGPIDAFFFDHRGMPQPVAFGRWNVGSGLQVFVSQVGRLPPPVESRA